MAFFGHFWQKMRFFLVMAAPKHSITCSKKLHTHFFDSSALKIGWGALQLPTQAPKTLFWAKDGIFFGDFGAKNAVFW